MTEIEIIPEPESLLESPFLPDLGMTKRSLRRLKKKKKRGEDKKVESTERIVGGQQAVAGVWKWIVHFPILKCAGTILGKYNSLKSIFFISTNRPLVRMDRVDWFRPIKVMLFTNYRLITP